MDYGNAFRKVWDSCENIFDLAVCCYDKILLYVENEQNFIAKYMDHPKRDGKGNPNLKNLDGRVYLSSDTAKRLSESMWWKWMWLYR